MSIVTPETNTGDSTTDTFSASETLSDQRSPTTRRTLLWRIVMSEHETTEIERNSEFHATIVRRRGAAPAAFVAATDIFPDL